MKDIFGYFFEMFYHLVVFPLLVTFFLGMLWPLVAISEKDVCEPKRYVTKYTFWEVGCFATDMLLSKLPENKK